MSSTKIQKIREYMMSGPLSCSEAARLFGTAQLPTIASKLRSRGETVERCDIAPGVTAYRINWEKASL